MRTFLCGVGVFLLAALFSTVVAVLMTAVGFVVDKDNCHDAGGTMTVEYRYNLPYESVCSY